MKIVAFQLTMPGCGSWNGRWSGEGSLYAALRKLPDEKATQLDNQRFGYSWEDGWRATVECRVIDAKEARKLRKASKGFCGYEWMITSIINNGCIDVEAA